MNLDIDNTRVNELTDYSPADADDSPAELMIPRDFAGLRIDQALARLFPEHSRSRLQAWLREGRILVDGGTPDAKHRIWGGERLLVSAAPEPQTHAEQAEDIPLNIVFEDADVLVVNKPAGLVVHPGSGNWSGTLLNALLHHAPALEGVPRAGIVHRLDKDTSGLLVVAKTLAAQTDLIRQLQARTVKRHYLALVHGVVAAAGEVDAPIGRHPSQRTKMAVVGNGRPALTRYVVRERLAKTSLLECRLETGRTHQIRVHMAHIGHPLVGDPVYGLKRAGDPIVDAFSRQALHAFRLGLVHPSSGLELEWFAPIAEDILSLVEQLGGHHLP
ncbi:23S rRNA pseudouridine(1911/1915/1917) synthase RluD [Azoarcus sp. L1K30]|uniref:23S rRNA pseudouridine(1911/1915/1917) synthase RluD n=1 Tax=Azoarcus sp. L1K30 TaxID=2820277 RepID=UPI0032C21CE3